MTKLLKKIAEYKRNSEEMERKAKEYEQQLKQRDEEKLNSNHNLNNHNVLNQLHVNNNLNNFKIYYYINLNELSTNLDNIQKTTFLTHLNHYKKK